MLHGGHGRRKFRSRTIRRPTSRPWPRCGPTSCAKPATGTTAPGLPIRGLVAVAMEVFDAQMSGPNQLGRSDPRRRACPGGRFARVCPQGPITAAEDCATNVAVGLRYLESWLRGQGCVPIFNLMEDAATAEISRAQIWQWIRHPRGHFADGTKITAPNWFEQMLSEELGRTRDRRSGDAAYAASRSIDDAGKLFLSVSTARPGSSSFLRFRPTSELE